MDKKNKAGATIQSLTSELCSMLVGGASCSAKNLVTLNYYQFDKTHPKYSQHKDMQRRLSQALKEISG
jgi:hypothetical protein